MRKIVQRTGKDVKASSVIGSKFHGDAYAGMKPGHQYDSRGKLKEGHTPQPPQGRGNLARAGGVEDVGWGKKKSV
jgi:hypothetical protein